MSENKLKVVVIDDNEARKKNISEILPDYMDVFLTVYGNGAKEQIVPAADGRKCDLVIMNADDRKGQSLYMFDWLKKDSDSLRLDRIPVLLLCEDEFSDRILSFLELGDAEIYEGDIEPDDFFITVSSILNEAEFMPDPDDEIYPAYSEKSADRIFGMSFKPEGEDENTVKRSTVFNNSEQLKHLEIALERGRKKQQLIQDIMEAAVRIKEQNQDQDEPETEDLINRGRGESLYNLDASRVGEILDETLVKYEDPSYDSNAFVEKTIAIVDADNSNIKLLDIYLHRRFNLVTLNSGMSAIDFFVKNKADLLLISFNMPILDGTKILDSIRWQPNGKNVPAIFMVEGDVEKIKPLCRKEGVIGILQKPVSQMAVKQAIDSVFAK